MTDIILLPTWEELLQHPNKVLLEQGSNFSNSKLCQIKATHDLEAIGAWLDEYRDTPLTHRVYSKEVERLLLWCYLDRQKPLSALTRDDLKDYECFLSNPMPQDLWCGRKGPVRGSPQWRPFEKGLSQSSINKAMSALKSLFNFLVDVRYLEVNPLSIRRRSKNQKQAISDSALAVSARILNDDEWEAMLDVLNSWPETTDEERFAKQRLILIVHTLFFLGLRVSELVSHTWGNFRQIKNHWWFFVTGKGGKQAKIPVSLRLMLTIADYRLLLKLPIEPASYEQRPIIQHLTSEKPLGARAINSLLKELALETAKRFTGEPHKVEKLKQFSPHWLRHLSASMQDRAGVKFTHIRDNLRHSKDDTTRIYVHAEDEERVESISQLKLVPEHKVKSD